MGYWLERDPFVHSVFPTPQSVTRFSDFHIIRLKVRRISLTEFVAADEVFTTGTMGELTPVVMIDGR